MNAIEKLLRKIHTKDRERIIVLIEALLKDTLPLNSDIKKIQDTGMYRLRTGRFRILFYYKVETHEPIIVNVTLRQKDTYK